MNQQHLSSMLLEAVQQLASSSKNQSDLLFNLSTQLQHALAPTPVPTSAPPVQYPYQPVQQPQPIHVQHTPQLQPQNTQGDIMQDFLTQLKLAIGSGLTPDDQLWVSANYSKLPAFFKSAMGQDSVRQLVAQYKMYAAMN